MKKAIVAAAAALGLVLALSGCGGTGKSDEDVYIPDAPAVEETDAAAAQSLEPSPAPEENYDAEKAVADLFKGDEMSAEDVKKLFTALPEIHWCEYERYTDGKAMELISWLYRRNTAESEEILSIMNATDGLDGAFSEGYAGVLDNAFVAGPETFIKCLAQIDPAKAERVDAYIAYDCDYGARDTVKEAITLTKELISGAELSDAERQAAEQLVRTIEVGPPV